MKEKTFYPFLTHPKNFGFEQELRDATPEDELTYQDQ
jgi:hypothetical protein